MEVQTGVNHLTRRSKVVSDLERRVRWNRVANTIFVTEIVVKILYLYAPSVSERILSARASSPSHLRFTKGYRILYRSLRPKVRIGPIVYIAISKATCSVKKQSAKRRKAQF